jgi:ribosome biogenesis GTPase
MELNDLGYNQTTEETVGELNQHEGFELGRVIIEHRERYTVQTTEHIFQAEITGSLRYSAESRTDFPAVGDWVKLSVFDEDAAIIIEVLPRFSVLERQSVGRKGEQQIIAANVDVAFIVQAVGHDFNLNRLERYLAICSASSIQPIVIVSKTDLITKEEIQATIDSVKKRTSGLSVIPISNETQSGYDELKSCITKGNTYCVLGSSGVGKSSLINNLLQNTKMEVSDISSSTSKGRHTTSHRELIVLPEGGVIIDTPGMRELGVTGSQESIEQTFDQITELTRRCKFKDCSHTEELGCAVIEALESGELDQELYENYHKLIREQAHYSSTVAERREKDKKMGKLYKRIQEEKYNRRR